MVFSGYLSAQKKQTISIVVKYIQPYCGGAKPTEEMEAEAQKPKPYADMNVVLFGPGKKCKTFKTGKNGELSLKLKPGNYKLYEYWKYRKLAPNSMPAGEFDPLCLEQEWKKEFLSIQVSEKGFDITEIYTISAYCPHTLPCIIQTHLPPVRQ